MMTITLATTAGSDETARVVAALAADKRTALVPVHIQPDMFGTKESVECSAAIAERTVKAARDVAAHALSGGGIAVSLF